MELATILLTGGALLIAVIVMGSVARRKGNAPAMYTAVGGIIITSALWAFNAYTAWTISMLVLTMIVWAIMLFAGRKRSASKGKSPYLRGTASIVMGIMVAGMAYGFSVAPAPSTIALEDAFGNTSHATVIDSTTTNELAEPQCTNPVYYANSAESNSFAFSSINDVASASEGLNDLTQRMYCDPFLAATNNEYINSGGNFDDAAAMTRLSDYNANHTTWAAQNDATFSNIKKVSLVWSDAPASTLGAHPGTVPSVTKWSNQPVLGKALVLELKNGETRTLRVECGYQPAEKDFSNVETTPIPEQPQTKTIKYTPPSSTTPPGHNPPPVVPPTTPETPEKPCEDTPEKPCKPTTPPEECKDQPNKPCNPTPPCEKDCTPVPPCTENCNPEPPCEGDDCNPTPPCEGKGCEPCKENCEEEPPPPNPCEENPSKCEEDEGKDPSKGPEQPEHHEPVDAPDPSQGESTPPVEDDPADPDTAPDAGSPNAGETDAPGVDEPTEDNQHEAPADRDDDVAPVEDDPATGEVDGSDSPFGGNTNESQENNNTEQQDTTSGSSEESGGSSSSSDHVSTDNDAPSSTQGESEPPADTVEADVENVAYTVASEMHKPSQESNLLFALVAGMLAASVVFMTARRSQHS